MIIHKPLLIIAWGRIHKFYTHTKNNIVLKKKKEKKKNKISISLYRLKLALKNVPNMY